MANKLVCCVSGCKTRQSINSKRKLHRIPSGSGPFQAKRRRLWVQAIQRANGSTDELEVNARICGAHFKSGQVSMDHASPDFVPSVFSCRPTVRKRGRPKKVKCQRPTSNVEMEERTTPPRVDSPMDLQPYVLMEELQTPSTPSVPQDGETLTKEPETETTPVKSQTTFSPCKASPSFNAPAGMPNLDKSLIVLLKHIYVPTIGYQCEQCNQSFPNTSQLMKHKKLHDDEISFVCEKCGTFFKMQADFTEHRCVEEPSFPCNMCDQSFTTSGTLKRHKLLHVKDGRKCPECGVVFCQRHNHILYLPSAETITEYEEDPVITKPKNVHRSLMPETPQKTISILPSAETITEHEEDPVTTKPKNVHRSLMPENHQKTISILPSAETITEHEEDPATTKPKNVHCSLMPENHQKTISILPSAETITECEEDPVTTKPKNVHWSLMPETPQKTISILPSAETITEHEEDPATTKPKNVHCSLMPETPQKTISILPSAETITECEEDPVTTKPQNVHCSLMPENHLLVTPEPSQNADLDHDARSNKTVLPGPLSKTRKTPASQARISSEIHVPVFPKPRSASGLPPPVPTAVPTVSWKPQKLSWYKLPRPICPAPVVKPLLPTLSDLPPSLKMFSPLYLRSALLEVKRNYEYILSKPIGVNKNTVKEEH